MHCSKSGAGRRRFFGHSAAAAVVAAAGIPAAAAVTAAAEQDDDQDNDPQAAATAKTVIAAPHMSTSLTKMFEKTTSRFSIHLMCNGRMGAYITGIFPQRRPQYRPPRLFRDSHWGAAR